MALKENTDAEWDRVIRASRLPKRTNALSVCYEDACQASGECHLVCLTTSCKWIAYEVAEADHARFLQMLAPLAEIARRFSPEP